MSYIHPLRILLFTSPLVFTAGCASSECLENKNSLPFAGFYTNPENPVSVSISGLKVWGKGVPNDSLLLPGSESADCVYLPFKIDSDQTSFVFELNTDNSSTEDHGNNTKTLIEEVTFHYKRQQWFASAACGAIYNFRITSIEYSGLFIDSIACPGNLITNENRENLNIYFKNPVIQKMSRQETKIRTDND